ncbi:hypothetical protein DIURU_004199 [Diutina rugosa]|uniref:Dol-P-Man:Man(5)GlcNAc(2)-PP-Dol alpha-1,3-mannosyltransferase n=1 Tax=Diutina rugosa TaxID=5481 RepID=A0A642UKB2_DIURU|nr:uncharacterized protein DIURU_004199 [Diutina rugosa]KAA8899532.1 hypothetical protein DIURU_004199 [Diutina rugosa]
MPPSPPAETQPEAQPELPEFTFANVRNDIISGVKALIYDPRCSRLVAPLVVVLTSLACKIIIAKVPYTEIDFSTYMQQIAKVNNGEIDYSEIYGDSGPIVYPAGFIAVYKAIAQLTDGGADIKSAQQIFSYVLIFTNLLAVLTYVVSYVPPWTIYLLLCSKRIFSIYVLRMFNDCFTTLAMVAVTLIYQQAAYQYNQSSLISFLLAAVGMDVYSMAVSIKMNALLYLPAVLLVTYFVVGQSTLKLLLISAIFPFIQLIMGWNYLVPLLNDKYAVHIRWNYINNAFDFKRKFLYKWTVNWRFIGEKWFNSDVFAKILLLLHVAVLLWFLLTRFLSPQLTGEPRVKLITQALKGGATPSAVNKYLDPVAGPRLVMLVFSVTNVVGVMASRSLHYQFLSWYLWQLPFLLWSTGWPMPVCIVVWVAHEYCWNVFPSTSMSSALLVTILGAILTGVWFNPRIWGPSEPISTEKKEE